MATVWAKAGAHLVRAFHGRPFAKDTIAHARAVRALLLVPVLDSLLPAMVGTHFAFQRRRWAKARKQLEASRRALEEDPMPDVTGDERVRTHRVLEALAHAPQPATLARLAREVRATGAAGHWNEKQIRGALDQLYWCGVLYAPTAPCLALTESGDSKRQVLDVARVRKLLPSRSL